MGHVVREIRKTAILYRVSYIFVFRLRGEYVALYGLLSMMTLTLRKGQLFINITRWADAPELAETSDLQQNWIATAIFKRAVSWLYWFISCGYNLNTYTFTFIDVKIPLAILNKGS